MSWLSRFACVTTRLPKDKDKKTDSRLAARKGPMTRSPSAKADPPTQAGKTNPPALAARANGATNNASARAAGSGAPEGTNAAGRRQEVQGSRQADRGGVCERGRRGKMVPVKIGISDDNYWEITEGLSEGQEVVSGGFRAITRDLEDGKKIRKAVVGTEQDKDKEEKKSE